MCIRDRDVTVPDHCRSCIGRFCSNSALIRSAVQITPVSKESFTSLPLIRSALLECAALSTIPSLFCLLYTSSATTDDRNIFIIKRCSFCARTNQIAQNCNRSHGTNTKDVYKRQVYSFFLSGSSQKCMGRFLQ